jgi:mannose-1-phosphate guanylyltransferase/phosphomannomutase
VKALILAAGEGTRLRPLTLDRPKPMVPVGGKPVLEHLITWLRDYGVRDIAINLHHCPEVIPRYFGDGSSWGIRLAYSYERTILGSAGAIKELESFLTETFLVVYGDVLTDLNLADLVAFHREALWDAHAPVVTLALYEVENPTECGIVELDERRRILRIVEKPAAHEVFGNLANAGVCVMEPDVMSFIRAGRFSDIAKDLLPLLLERNLAIRGFLLDPATYLVDIGIPERYLQSQRDWPIHLSRHTGAPRRIDACSLHEPQSA